jgi:hypothetical protein
MSRASKSKSLTKRGLTRKRNEALRLARRRKSA